MLGIRRIAAGRVDYYLADLAVELPVSVLWSGGAGRWVGEAAADLGLDVARGGARDRAAPVEASQFRSLLAGRHPGTGRPLPTGHRRVAAYDLTFSAPKSVSVVFALGGEETARAVVASHLEAVDGALAYLERHGLGATRSRRAQGERDVVATSGFAGAVFTHGLSRNLDPHLHSHVVVVNAVHGLDGRWSACDGRGLDAHRAAAGGVYDASLRHALGTTLGLRWDAAGEPGRTWEVSGVPPALLGEFSSRGADVRMHALATGARSARGRQVAWAATRPPKRTGTSYDELATEWRRRAGAAGPELELERRTRSPSPVALESYDEHRFAGAIAAAPHKGAHRRDVVAAFAGSARDGAPAASIDHVTDLWAPEARVGVAEELRAPQSVVPANHHLRALGPRPVDPAGHETWVTVARAIDAYRQRWGIERVAEPLGTKLSLSSLPPARLAHHLRVARELDAARAALGRRAPTEMELGLDR
jgi:conjugative relaxase-like TrwC/TraI family protein